MTRALAVAALVGCACGQSSNLPAPRCPACPTCPAMPGVDLALCPVERPGPPLVVTEPADDSVLVRGSGFWCSDFVAGRWAGESNCFRLEETCEEARRRYRKPPHKTTACRPVERASCMKIHDYRRMVLFYRCLLPAQCEAHRTALIARRPDLGVGECRELN